MKTKLLFVLTFLFAVHGVGKAHDFVYNKVYYSKLSDNSVAVVSPSQADYSGDIEIPMTVRYDGVEYRVTIIDKGAFQVSNITSVSLPNSIVEIRENAFSGCKKLSGITIPESVLAIADNAFNNCDNMKSFSGKFATDDGRCLVIDGKLIAFAPSGLTSYSIPDGVTSIGNSVFDHYHQLNEVIIPQGVVRIGERAFYYCSTLKSVSIPATVSEIGANAFSGTKVQSMYVYSSNPEAISVGTDALNFSLATCELFVPKGCKEKYASAEPWKNFESINEVETGQDMCESPEIVIENDKLVVRCQTPGAKIHTTITASDAGSGEYSSGDVIPLSGEYAVSAYASAEGKIDSEPSQAVLVWSEGADILTSANGLSAERLLLLASEGDSIMLRGTAQGERVELYSLDGICLYSGVSMPETTVIPVPFNRGGTYIVKVGEQTMKYRF